MVFMKYDLVVIDIENEQFHFFSFKFSRFDLKNFNFSLLSLKNYDLGLKKYFFLTYDLLNSKKTLKQNNIFCYFF